MSAKSRKPSETEWAPSIEALAPSLIGASPSVTKPAERFRLGWFRFVTLVTLDSANVRRLGEIEAADNGWSIRELKRRPHKTRAIKRRRMQQLLADSIRLPIQYDSTEGHALGT